MEKYGYTAWYNKKRSIQSHGIGVEGGAAEVSTDAGQPQVHEEDEEQCTGPADGIVEEAVPETILPMDDEYES